MINWLANPRRFLSFARFASPILGWTAFLLIPIGLYYALIASPADMKQGESVRIMYIHAPAVWLAMLAYAIIAVASFISYIWRHPLADIGAKACALPGAAFTLIGLITGSLWGSVTWMTYWVWDGRLTSFLVLFFLYIGYICIWQIIEDPKRAARIASLVAMVGAVNLPIIKFSVDWWDDVLHQRATLTSFNAPGLDWSMGRPLLFLMLGFTALFGWLVINAVVTDIAKIRRKQQQSTPASATITLENLT